MKGRAGTRELTVCGRVGDTVIWSLGSGIDSS